jgi:hypothetical protein
MERALRNQVRADPVCLGVRFWNWRALSRARVWPEIKEDVSHAHDWKMNERKDTWNIVVLL